MSATKNSFYAFIERSFLLEWLLAFVLVIIARLPYLLSDHVYFDGDEAMLGIMGRDLITGQNLPIYFYGQRYGFSFFEALSVGIFIPFLGSGVASLKLGGMLLFSLGIQRFMKIFRVKGFSFISYLLITITFVLFPTWLVWGTKLRGGYITAFVGLAFIVEQLLLYNKWEQKNWNIVACISALIIVSQSFFILPVAPILLHRAFKLSWRQVLTPGLVGGFTLFLLRIPAYFLPDYWDPSVHVEFELEKLHYFFVEGFWSNFTGYFAFSDIYDVPPLTKISIILFFSLMVIGVVFSLFFNRTEDKKELLLLLGGLLISIVPVSFFGVPGGRYLLPFCTGWMIILLFVIVRSVGVNQQLKRVYVVLNVSVLTLGLFEFNQFVSFWMEPQLNDMKVLNELVEEFKQRDIEHGFVTEWQVLWQLNYLADEKMSFRFLFQEDRIERYTEKVNDCYLRNDCKTALTGSLWPLRDMQNVDGWNDRMVRINERFYIMVAPEEKFLLTAGFELPKGKSE